LRRICEDVENPEAAIVCINHDQAAYEIIDFEALNWTIGYYIEDALYAREQRDTTPDALLYGIFHQRYHDNLEHARSTRMRLWMYRDGVRQEIGSHINMALHWMREREAVEEIGEMVAEVCRQMGRTWNELAAHADRNNLYHQELSQARRLSDLLRASYN
jgi:hypothetical protein